MQPYYAIHYALQTCTANQRSAGRIPQVHEQLSLCKILHLITVQVVDGCASVAIGPEAAVDVRHQVHGIIPAQPRCPRYAHDIGC